MPFRLLTAATLVAALCLPAFALADDDIPEFVVVDGDTLWLADTVEVVGSRVPAALPGTLRRVDLLTTEDFERLPGRSAAELLQMVPGVVVRQRQQYGVQSDISIRGSSFEQVQVLLDGFDLGDPQTGHHLMDLPLGRQDIRRLEVLPGHGSALYGSGAFGGTVNVVSQRPGDRTGGEVALLGGGAGTWGARGNTDLVLGQDSAARLSLERFRTDGYDVPQPDGTMAWGGNDADTWAGTGRFNHTFDTGEMDVFAGYSARDFGALDYYAPYPSREKTETAFTALRYNRSVGGGVTLEPRAFYRRHTDEFVLFRDNPEAYTNDHVSQKTGGELRGIVDLGRGHALAAGVEAVYEDIDSQGLRGGVWGEALGFHKRRRLSGAVEVDRSQGDWRWQLGARVDRRTGYDARPSGTAATAYDLSEAFSVRASAGSVYRVPTFTELYYESPANMGNPALDPEEGWTWDGGVDWRSGPWLAGVTYFERYETNLIDWVRPASADPALVPWQVQNVADGTARGLETSARWQSGRGHGVVLGYTWLEKENTLPGDQVGKYTLLAPRHQLQLAGTLQLPWRLALTATSRYLEHTGGPADFQETFVLDSRLTWALEPGWFANLTGSNLLDTTYQEVPGLWMPGTLFTLEAGKRF